MLAAALTPARSLRLISINRCSLRHASSLSAINRALNKGRLPESQRVNYPARRAELETGRGSERQSGRDSERYPRRESEGRPRRESEERPRRESERYPRRESERYPRRESERQSGRDLDRHPRRESERYPPRESERQSGRDSDRRPRRESERHFGRESERYSGKPSGKSKFSKERISGGSANREDWGTKNSEDEVLDRPRYRTQRDQKDFGRRTSRRDTYSDHDTGESRSNRGLRTNRGGAEDAERGSRRPTYSVPDVESTRTPNRPRERSALYQDILDMPFQERADFTPEKWDRLMLAISDAEARYTNLLPSEPKELPTLKGKPNTILTRELKHGLKDALKEVEPKLEEPRKEWVRLIQHLRHAYDVANGKDIKIPGRAFFEETDPVSSRRAVSEQFTPGSIHADSQRPLSQDQIKKYLRSCIDIHLGALTNPARTLSIGEQIEQLKASTALTREPASEETREEGDGIPKTPEELAAKEKKRLKMAKKREERRAKEEMQGKAAVRGEEIPDFEDTLGFSSGAITEPTTSKFKPADVGQSTRERPREEQRSMRERPRHETESRQKPTSADHETSEDAYVSIPYTTAASEFLYGLNVVYAALKAKRRKLYTLYIYNSANHAFDMSSSDRQLQKMAKEANVKVRLVSSDFLPTMDKMASGRPHNGVVLETSTLPFVPVKALGKIDITSTNIPLQIGDQSQEERAVNGIPTGVPYPAHTWRKPFVLLLDGILDPGNLGNILRTAYFYGVDAVAICTNTCAPVNLATVQKAASGAAEALTLLAIPFPAAFVSSCAKNGWQVFAAVAPDAATAKGGKQHTPIFTDTMSSPLAKGPGLLMLGAEGEGLRQNLLDKATSNVSIRGFERRDQIDIGVESLNVGTATAVLVEAFCRKPGNLEDVIEKKEGQFAERII